MPRDSPRKASRDKASSAIAVLLHCRRSHLQGAAEFPFALLIPQSEVEKFLVAKVNALGVEVHRETRLIGMEAGGVEDTRLVYATCVIAADGSRSTVRAGFLD